MAEKKVVFSGAKWEPIVAYCRAVRVGQHVAVFGRAHQEAFADVTPATSMVEVSRLIGDGMLIEIEADAIIDES